MKTSTLNIATSLLLLFLASATLSSCSKDDFSPLADAGFESNADAPNQEFLKSTKDATRGPEGSKTSKSKSTKSSKSKSASVDSEFELFVIDYAQESAEQQFIQIVKRDGKRYLSLNDLIPNSVKADDQIIASYEMLIQGVAVPANDPEHGNPNAETGSKILSDEVQNLEELKELRIPSKFLDQCSQMQLKIKLSIYDASGKLVQQKLLHASDQHSTIFLYCFN